MSSIDCNKCGRSIREGAPCPHCHRPRDMAQAIEWANQGDSCLWYSSSCGRIELAITLDDASSCSHAGQCDDDVRELSRVSYIAEQLAAVNVETLREVLREYGAWDDGELADHEQNLQRLLWSACNDITDEAAQ